MERKELVLTEEEDREKVRQGLEHIAFGSVRDPVRLLFCEELSLQALRRMDLFNISEIKRPKGGGMEIKFFDRIRAMQCLRELGESKSAPSGFYEALEAGARALNESGEDT